MKQNASMTIGQMIKTLNGLLLLCNSSVALLSFRWILEYLANSSVMHTVPNSSLRSETWRLSEVSTWLSHMKMFNSFKKQKKQWLIKLVQKQHVHSNYQWN